MKFLVDLWLDGYEDEEEREAACLEFITEALDFTASSVSAEKYDEEAVKEALAATLKQDPDGLVYHEAERVFMQAYNKTCGGSDYTLLYQMSKVLRPAIHTYINEALKNFPTSENKIRGAKHSALIVDDMSDVEDNRRHNESGS